MKVKVTPLSPFAPSLPPCCLSMDLNPNSLWMTCPVAFISTTVTIETYNGQFTLFSYTDRETLFSLLLSEKKLKSNLGPDTDGCRDKFIAPSKLSPGRKEGTDSSVERKFAFGSCSRRDKRQVGQLSKGKTSQSQ